MPNDPSPPPASDPAELSVAAGSEPSVSASARPQRQGELPPPVTAGRGWYSVSAQARASDFWVLVGCNAIVFGASVCIMVLELTASRLIANYVGQSLYTWTSVIGVVLAGISIGNYVGGYLADRFDPRKVLARLFLLAGLLTASVLFTNGWAASTRRPEGMHWQLWVMLVVAWVFFLPALALGTISPVTASMALRRSAKTGITVGNIYAWGALGSIVGTFLAGFWLIGEFGSRQVISMTAVLLVLIGVLVAVNQRAVRTAGLAGLLPLIALFWLLSSATGDGISQTARLVAGIRSAWRTAPADFFADEQALARAVEQHDDRGALAARERRRWRDARLSAETGWAKWGRKLGIRLHELGLLLALRADEPDEYNDESDYYTINIGPRQLNADDEVKQLRLDYLVHSYYDPNDPTRLHYEYEEVYAAVTERAFESWQTLTEVPLEPFPYQAEMTAQFPENVRYDPAAQKLSARGALDYAQLRSLLSIGPYARFWGAAVYTWEQANTNWEEASRKNRGAILTPLFELPRDITIPEEVTGKLHYDPVLKALVCTAPFDHLTLQTVLIQGEMKEYLQAVQLLYARSRQVSVMFIGGGGFVFPRWIESKFDDKPRIDVAEIDPAVKRAVEAALELPSEYGPPEEGKTWIDTHFGDARNFVDDRLRENEKREKAGELPVTYDFVYGDAFNDLSVPWHLTTAEFSGKIRDLLTPDRGVFLVNIIDIYPRTQYPPKSDKIASGDVDFQGELPRSLAPATIPSGEFAPCRGEFPGLAVQQIANGYRLRYSGVMSKQTSQSLQELDLASAPGVKGRFAAAIGSLYEKTNVRSHLAGPAPRALLKPNYTDWSWQSAPEPFGNVQVMSLRNRGYLLGLRGVMSDDLRSRLLALPEANDEFKRAVESIYRRSRDEKVGRFLGRYLHTARKIFPFVYLFTSNENEIGELRDTFIVACSLQKLDFEDLESSGGHWKAGPFAWTELGPDGRKDFGEMPAVLELARNLDLTDDFAPLDNLLAPVFVSRSEDPDD